MVISCTSGERPSPVQETVDQGYLNSEPYQHFKEQATQEQQRTSNRGDELADYIGQRITNFGARTLELPAVIDGMMIESVHQKYREKPPAVLRAFGGPKRYYPVAQVKLSSLNYNIFMLCEVAGYENCLLMLATSQEGEVNDMETIGVFNRSVSYRASSHISIKSNRIDVETTKTVMHPFEQTNTVSETFNISESGEINQINN